MQHLTSVIWSLDNKFVLSASDEMNIRIWKANASEKLGTVRFFLYINLNRFEKIVKGLNNYIYIKKLFNTLY